MDDKVIKALGDPTRFHLLALMAEEGCCVRALAYRCNLSEPAVSQHLKVLREADLVQGIRRGYYTHYRINREKIAEIITAFSSLIDDQKKGCRPSLPGCSVAEEVECRNALQKAEG